MSTHINIDAGGTFTDCFTIHDGEYVTSKTPTTEFDLSECFVRSIRSCAEQLDRDIDPLLRNTDSIRYSTTIAMNRLIEREGPKIGLITTAGVQDYPFIGRGSQWADGLTDRERRNLANVEKPEPLVPEELVVGVRERIDSFGEVQRPLDEAHVREQARTLVDRGARSIGVCLLWAHQNPTHEQRVREILRDEFPPSYLGNVPVFLSSEIMPTKQEYERTNTVILDAYLSQLMQEHIADIKDRLEAFGYEGDIQMIHNTGGMAESYKTTAVETYNGGPVATLMGSEYLANQLGYEKAVVTDMGGTSFDIGILVGGGAQSYDFEPVIDRWLVAGSMIESKSIGAGGGSIAWVNEELDDRLEIGPQSAGADPGPACYNRGGTRPTVTDADLVLGYLDPEAFYAGNQTLDADRAEAAIEEHVADPLGLDVVEAAARIRQIVDANMGDTIRKETLLRGHDPREFLVFSYGGAGPVHGASYASHLDIDTVVTSPYSPVFGAMGSSTMDRMHMAEQSHTMYLVDPGERMAFTESYEEFNENVDKLQAEIRSDLVSEGADEDEIDYQLELDLRFGGQIHVARVPSPVLRINSAADVESIYETFVAEYEQRFSSYSVTPVYGVMAENFVLRGSVAQDPVELRSASTVDDDVNSARLGSRDVHWASTGGFVETPVYEYDALKPGMATAGPAIVQADYTTTAVPPDWTYRLDEYHHGLLEPTTDH